VIRWNQTPIQGLVWFSHVRASSAHLGSSWILETLDLTPFYRTLYHSLPVALIQNSELIDCFTTGFGFRYSVVIPSADFELEKLSLNPDPILRHICRSAAATLRHRSTCAHACYCHRQQQDPADLPSTALSMLPFDSAPN